jgi:sRNA-binding carbon storage regulator CsrA
MDKVYLEVLKLVKKGVTIEKACKTVKVNRTKFYASITKEQKNELRFYKSSTLIHGTCGHYGTRDFISFENEN